MADINCQALTFAPNIHIDVDLVLDWALFVMDYLMSPDSCWNSDLNPTTLLHCQHELNKFALKDRALVRLLDDGFLFMPYLELTEDLDTN